MYKFLYKSFLSRLNPERAHNMALWALSNLPSRKPKIYSNIAVNAFGRSFSSPVGVAAGLDKNGIAIGALLGMGFSHVEVGTVTPEPQEGNPKPRVWRIQNRGIRNSMGFPSDGVLSVYENIGRTPYNGVVGLNFSKNRDTSFEEFLDQIYGIIEIFHNRVGYYTINVSSPNTPGLRDFQQAYKLQKLLDAVKTATGRVAWKNFIEYEKPVLVKFSPDMSFNDMEDSLCVALDCRVSGVIISNTTNSGEGGGISGPLLKAKSNKMISFAYENVIGDNIPIIGVGGVSSSIDVIEKMKLGASLVQLYTAFVYEGPSLIKKINKELSLYVEKENLSSISDIIGDWA